uniref:Uncharacterized protein n=1 Tax=Romanomermis culicivorax TaxID=13658 RepID=A0A915L3E8_ROMCU
MKQRNSIKYCIITHYNIEEKEHEGNCSKGFHCFGHPGAYTPSNERLGVCCPKDKRSENFHMVCPQDAIAVSNVTCPDQSRIIADQHFYFCFDLLFSLAHVDYVTHTS